MACAFPRFITYIGGDPLFRLFIVEDDENIREGLMLWNGWAAMDIAPIGSAGDGKTGLEQILTLKADVVLTDVKMPYMDGLEMSRALREAGWNGALIFLSAYSDIEKLKGAIRVSADDYLLKPIDDEQLNEAIRNAIRKLEQRLDYAQLQRYERWHRLLRGEEDDVPCGPYAVGLLHAPHGLAEILDELQRTVGILWADKLSATEAAVIWIGADDPLAVEKQAEAFKAEWDRRGVDASWRISAPTAESWRITALLKRLQNQFSMETTVSGTHAESESLDDLSGRIVSGILSGGNPAWVETHMEEIWSSLCRCGAQTMRELQDNSILLIQMLARTSGAKAHQDFCEKWRKKTCMLLLECCSAREVRHVVLTGLKTLSIFFSENAGTLSILNKLRQTVLQNLQEISLALLVEKTGLSKWNITKIIRSECSLSVNEWIQSIRLEEARRMLLDTNMKVYEISRIVGYTSVDYFTGIFRAKHGTTPEKYRQAGSSRSQ